MSFWFQNCKESTQNPIQSAAVVGPVSVSIMDSRHLVVNVNVSSLLVGTHSISSYCSLSHVISWARAEMTEESLHNNSLLKQTLSLCPQAALTGMKMINPRLENNTGLGKLVNNISDWHVSILGCKETEYKQYEPVAHNQLQAGLSNQCVLLLIHQSFTQHSHI